MAMEDDGKRATADAEEKEAWDRAVAKASKDAYQAFVDKYPESVRANVARMRLAASSPLKDHRQNKDGNREENGRKNLSFVIAYNIVAFSLVCAIVILGLPRGANDFISTYAIANVAGNIILGIVLAYPLTRDLPRVLVIPIGLTVALILSGAEIGYYFYAAKAGSWSQDIRREFIDTCSKDSENMRGICVCYQREFEARVSQSELDQGEEFYATPKGKQSVADAGDVCGVARVRQFQDGNAAYQRGEYTRAFHVLRPLAEQGFSQAQTLVGLMLLKDQGVPEDKAEALKWLTKAAELENENALKALAEVKAEDARKFQASLKSGGDQGKRQPGEGEGAAPKPNAVLEAKQPVTNADSVLVALNKIPPEFVGRWAATWSNSPLLYSVMRNCDVFNIEFTERHTYMYIQSVCDSEKKTTNTKMYCGDVRLFSKVYLSGSSLVGMFDGSAPGSRRVLFTPKGDGASLDVKWGASSFGMDAAESGAQSIMITLGKCRE